MAVAIAALLAACGRAQPDRPPFDERSFLRTTAHLAFSDVDLGAQAARKGEGPETRQLGLAVAAEQGALLAALAPLAQRRGLKMPVVLEDRRAALHQNLSVLAGPLFDRGWALAMVQDYDAILRGMAQASASNDADVRDFVARYRPVVAARRATVNELLGRLGGTPFE